jgi:hypothetical protein
MTVIRHPDVTWQVVNADGETLSLHATNADAWRWAKKQREIDRAWAERRAPVRMGDPMGDGDAA